MSVPFFGHFLKCGNIVHDKRGIHHCQIVLCTNILDETTFFKNFGLTFDAMCLFGSQKWGAENSSKAHAIGFLKEIGQVGPINSSFLRFFPVSVREN